MHTSLLPVASLLMRSLGWTLLYSLWQGLIIYMALLFLLRVFKNMSAQVKYGLSFISFSALCTWFADTWINQWQRLQVSTVFITQGGTESGITHTFSVSSLPQAAQNNLLQHILPHLETYMPLLITAYMLGLLFMLLRFSVNLWRVRILRKQGLTHADSSLYQQLGYWQSELGISRSVRLYLSNRIQVPAMMGVLKPVILLPLATISQLSPDQLEAILIHELAHIKRHDYLLNILQTVVETLLFFNPFVWWMSAIIRREREHCCDDIVVAHTSQALSYAKALAQLESNRTIPGAMALAATGNKNQLFNRIKRIMEMKKHSVNYSQLTVALIVIVALVVSVAWFTPSYAQHVRPDISKDSTIKKSKWRVDETYTITDDKGNTKVYHSYDDIPEDQKKLIAGEDHKTANTKTKVIVKTIDASDEPAETNDKDDMPDVSREIATATTAMASVPWDEVNKALKDVDWSAIGAEIASATTQAIDTIDWNKIQVEIKKAMVEAEKSIPDAKTRKEVEVRLKKELARAQAQVTKTGARVDAQVARVQARKDVAEARKQSAIIIADDDGDKDRVVVKADRIEVNDGDDHDKIVIASAGGHGDSYEKMLDRMEADGLIDRSQDFKIEKHNGALYINSNEQPASVYNKYKHYMSGKKVIIRGGANHLKITVKE